MPYSQEQMRAYMAARRARIRNEMTAYLGGKCAWCPSAEGLEFDHIDPRTKLFDIASGLDRPREVLLTEIRKCQLLCGPHHREKTLGDEPHDNHVRGERVGNARLTDDQAREIKMARGVPQQTLADAYGVSRWTVRSIRSGKSWQHV